MTVYPGEYGTQEPSIATFNMELGQCMRIRNVTTVLIIIAVDLKKGEDVIITGVIQMHVEGILEDLLQRALRKVNSKRPPPLTPQGKSYDFSMEDQVM